MFPLPALLRLFCFCYCLLETQMRRPIRPSLNLVTYKAISFTVRQYWLVHTHTNFIKYGHTKHSASVFHILINSSVQCLFIWRCFEAMWPSSDSIPCFCHGTADLHGLYGVNPQKTVISLLNVVRNCIYYR